MPGSMTANFCSAFVLMAILFGPLLVSERREIIAWFRDIWRDVNGPLP